MPSASSKTSWSFVIGAPGSIFSPRLDEPPTEKQDDFWASA